MDRRFKNCQYGQDDVIDKLCYPKGNETYKGIFLEIGACDGVDISNTYALEKMRDWSGLLVEPIEQYAKDAVGNRWCKVWQGCIYDRDDEIDFMHIRGYSQMLSCNKEAKHSSHKKRAQREISQHKQEVDII